MKYFAGIGSRKTPRHICNEMTELSKFLCNNGYCLYSGGAGGADSAFEKGASIKKIFLPWDGFNGRIVDNIKYFGRSDYDKQAKEIASTIHPKWNSLNDAAIKFHTRNVYQVLGFDLQTPVDFVVCWTEDGKIAGGTATAIRLAKRNNIPVYNMAVYNKEDIINKIGVNNAKLF